MNEIDPMDMPCCPFCDDAILEWHPAVVYFNDGVKCLAHADCAPELDDEDGDE